jgi:hypothetical protein
MAILRPASQLSSEDLPTFGRPTITTLGSAMTENPLGKGQEAIRREE